MSQTTATQTSNGTAPESTSKFGPVHMTEVELRQRPVPEGARAFQVVLPPLPQGATRWVYANDTSSALARVTRELGGKASQQGVDINRVTAMLGAMPEAELEALLARNGYTLQKAPAAANTGEGQPKGAETGGKGKKS